MQDGGGWSGLVASILASILVMDSCRLKAGIEPTPSSEANKRKKQIKIKIFSLTKVCLQVDVNRLLFWSALLTNGRLQRVSKKEEAAESRSELIRFKLFFSVID